MLKNANLKAFYSTGRGDDPSECLFNCLTNSRYFDLGLGYFSSSGFNFLAVGFAYFLKNGGKMRFIINDCLVEKDKEAIILGQESLSDEDIEHRLLNDFEAFTEVLSKRNEHFFNCLSWLISSKRLEIIAVVPKKNEVGIVHHKFGIFKDSEGETVVFNGSVNFSMYALYFNVENIWCEFSWEAQGNAKIRMEEMVNLFEETWNGKSDSVRIIPIDQITASIQKKFPKRSINELMEMEIEIANEILEHPTTSDDFKKKLDLLVEKLKAELISKQNALQPNKWEHQEKATAKFLEVERGILNMATGTGKTRTSLGICKKLIENNSIETIVITCDGNDLLAQWHKEILNLITNEDLNWIVLRHFESFHQSEIFRNNPIRKIMLISRQQLHLVLSTLSELIGSKTLLIHDEVHKLGSSGSREKLTRLSDKIRFRLGLSATPEREYDTEGTQFIIDHIGPIIFEFTLEDAIKKGILSPFDYYPVPYDLTSNDRDRLRNVHARKAARINSSNPMTDEEFWNELAKVYKTAEGKIPAFRNFISRHTQMLRRCVVFTETKKFAIEILDIIHQYHTDFHTYYGGEDNSILMRFGKGEIECLLTCHRLSEGIDIQSLKNVILVSSSKAKLETIQRIGRCLRIDPNNPKKIANVVDFIRTGDDEDDELNADEERQVFLTILSSIRPEKN